MAQPFAEFDLLPCCTFESRLQLPQAILHLSSPPMTQLASTKIVSPPPTGSQQFSELAFISFSAAVPIISFPDLHRGHSAMAYYKLLPKVSFVEKHFVAFASN